MDKIQVGNRISSLRKAKGLTQKQLAEKLHVTDKAVSKWERGLNFPDLMLIENLAAILGICAAELLGLEQATSEQTIAEVTQISQEEKKRITREIRRRAILTIGIGVLIGLTQLMASWEFHQLGADGGKYGSLTGGMMGFTGILVANAVYTLMHLKE